MFRKQSRAKICISNPFFEGRHKLRMFSLFKTECLNIQIDGDSIVEVKEF